MTSKRVIALTLRDHDADLLLEALSRLALRDEREPARRRSVNALRRIQAAIKQALRGLHSVTDAPRARQHRAVWQRGCTYGAMMRGQCRHALAQCRECGGGVCGRPGGQRLHDQRSAARIHKRQRDTTGRPA